MNQKKIISIVLPIYNEEQNIPTMYKGITEVCKKLIDRYEYEVIMVNDGSRDQSWKNIKEICTKDTRVRGVCFSRNFGKELALSAGIDICKGDCVITLDADGQHPIEKIYDFISCWENGYEIVYNVRQGSQEASWIKKISSHFFYKIFNSFSEFKLEPGATDYRLLDRKVIDIYKRCTEKNRMYRGLVDWLGFQRKSLIFGSPERLYGKPKYNYRKLFKLAVNNITSFSFFPLKFVGFLGLIISITSGSLLALQILDKLGFIHIGFSNLGIVIVINTILIGIVMMSLGILGLYIANINEEVIHRPIYIVRDRIN